MLELNDIKKDYVSGSTTVSALKGINLRFRDCECRFLDSPDVVRLLCLIL